MFCINEKVVYPGHGVAHINRIISKIVAGNEVLFYELSFIKGVTILVPIHNAEVVGIRKISTNETINTAFVVLSKPCKSMNNSEHSTYSWNKRSKEYQRKLTSGSLEDLLEIYKDLKYIEQSKELSFGERNILQQAETFLAEEIALSQKLEIINAIEKLRDLCANSLDLRNTKVKEIELHY